MTGRRIKGHIYNNKSERKERNQEIYRLWLTKQDEMSQEDIGKRYGLTKQRIGQIIKRQGELALEAERSATPALKGGA
jgi:DNA-directed RNA polymerase specialized sigma subunit